MRRWDSPLGWLGHRIARHPWSSLLLWGIVLVACVYPASNVGSVINGSFDNPLPSSDQSVQAQQQLHQQFPNAPSAPSSAILLLESSDVLGLAEKNATIALTTALRADGQLQNVTSVDSLYTSYSAYLAGEVQLGWGFLGAALSSSPSLPASVNQTAGLLWGPVAAYVAHWESLRANQSAGTPPSAANAPAYNATRADFASSPVELEVLAYFYNGSGGAAVGFNASLQNGCLTAQTVAECADGAARSSVPNALPSVLPSAGVFVGTVVLDLLGEANWSSAGPQQVVASTVLGSEVGVSPAWILTIWQAFPGSAPPAAAQVRSWAGGVVAADPVDRFPLPIPAGLYASFVNPSATAELVLVSFGVSDTYVANGSSLTFADVDVIQHVTSQVLASSASFAGIRAYLTGAAPLDAATNYLATSALSLLLALTILVLLVIMLVYFRAPSAPALAFGMIGIALAASFAAIYVVGRLVTTFNAEIESILLVFLMSIGTDYTVFLLARYREELVRGTEPREAVQTTVRWAGQSITTSGLAVMVVAAALTLSGISFLAQLGISLLISVALALLVNLTVLPSILVLVGPRIFWPNSGRRFARYAARRTENVSTHRDVIARAGRAATRRPVAVIALILLLSAPVVYVALQVPVSYDVTNIGLPADNPAQVGYRHLVDDFGASYTSGSFVLVTLSGPVLARGTPDAGAFTELAGLAAAMNGTPGVAGVSTLVGPGGVPLATWLNYSRLPPAVAIGLNQSLSAYVGADGRTVLFNVQTNDSGYSEAAIGVFHDLRERIGAYVSAHPGVTAVYYGGAAPTTEDIRSLVNQATEEMLVGAAIGLFVLMLLILGSAFVPLLALGVIGLSILWSWAASYFVVGILENEALIFLLPLILLILVLGLGMDYNVLLLTRVKEERTLGNRGAQAIRDAVTHAGGVITAAAVILGGAFLLLGFTSPLGLLAAIGLGIGFAVLLQAFVVQLFFTPAVLTLGRDGIWRGRRGRRP